MKYIKKLIFWAVLLGAFYFVLSNHFILVGNSVKLLKKSHLTLNYTVFSTKGKTIKSILSIDELREDGIGDILVEAGLMTHEELDVMTRQIEESGS